jgi:hypothetical protein
MEGMKLKLPKYLEKDLKEAIEERRFHPKYYLRRAYEEGRPDDICVCCGYVWNFLGSHSRHLCWQCNEDYENWFWKEVRKDRFECQDRGRIATIRQFINETGFSITFNREALYRNELNDEERLSESSKDVTTSFLRLGNREIE